jgi:hypothetical protein
MSGERFGEMIEIIDMLGCFCLLRVRMAFLLPSDTVLNQCRGLWTYPGFFNRIASKGLLRLEVLGGTGGYWRVFKAGAGSSVEWGTDSARKRRGKWNRKCIHSTETEGGALNTASDVKKRQIQPEDRL